MGGDGNDGSTKSGRLVTNDGHQRRNNRHHAGDKLWGFHKNSAYGFLNRIIHYKRYYYGKHHKVRSIFYRLFSVTCANDEITLSLPIEESRAPNLYGRYAKDTQGSLLTSQYV